MIYLMTFRGAMQGSEGAEQSQEVTNNFGYYHLRLESTLCQVDGKQQLLLLGKILAIFQHFLVM